MAITHVTFDERDSHKKYMVPFNSIAFIKTLKYNKGFWIHLITRHSLVTDKIEIFSGNRLVTILEDKED
ncbi:MAG: hypothetical protein MI867_10655 [Pseudomonadales bacterium]|nr:hypothetical protein [Pseudomonadales bacterium]